MFSLIITIISIALVGALAMATLYFGGDAFQQGSAKAAASTVVNQASQINGANTLSFLDNQAYAADVTALVTGDYLASAPNPGSISDQDYALSTDGSITLTGLTDAVCEQVNEQAGATQATYADLAAAVAGMGEQFGCHLVGASGSEVATFVFK